MEPPYNVYQDYNQNGYNNGYNNNGYNHGYNHNMNDKYNMNHNPNDYNYQHNLNQSQHHHARIQHRQTRSDTSNDTSPKKPKLRPMISPKAIICYGDKIRLRDGRDGIIKFIGTIVYREHEIWYGIILETPTGNNNGIQQNRFFFQCPPNHGLFVGRNQISAIIYTRVSPENGNRYCIKSKITCRHGTGTVKFIGHIPQSNNNNQNTLLYGISLKKRIRGGNNGMFHNVLYFVTKPYHGVFLTEKEMEQYRSNKQKVRPQQQRFANPNNVQFPQSVPMRSSQFQEPIAYQPNLQQQFRQQAMDNDMSTSEQHIYGQNDYNQLPSMNMRAVSIDQDDSSDDETDQEEDNLAPSTPHVNFASILEQC